MISEQTPISAIAKKLQMKPGKRWLLYNAPNHYFSILEPLPAGVIIKYQLDNELDGIQLFVANSVEIIDSLTLIKPFLKPDTILWITYPKKSSGIKSDLEMMGSWDEPAKYGLRIVTSVSVDDTWTALRFKEEALTRVSESRNNEIQKNEYSNYIDVVSKQIVLPGEILQALNRSPAALAYYQSLSYSNKKEYVIWILSAKQEKTKNERLLKLIEKLQDGKKNPSDK